MHIIARGKIARSPEAELMARYEKRLTWPLRLTELPETGGRIPEPQTPCKTVLLDERGQDLPSEKLAEAKARIAQHPDRIGGILGELSVTAPPAAIIQHIDRINRLFASDSYEEILAALEADGGEWAEKELATLHGKSPQTCKVALRQLKEGGEMHDFAAQMTQEYAIGSRVVQMHDFIEGVRALIVDKDNSPKWDPPTPEAVTDDWIDAIFAPLPENETWTPLP